MDVASLQRAHHGSGARRERRRLACRTALAYRGVAHITFPVDIQEKEVAARPRSQAQRAAPHVRRSGAARGLPERGRAAAGRGAAERAASKVAILAGRGALACRRRAGAGGRDARRADRQGAARQGRGARRQPVHHRRHRAARHPAVAGGDGGLRHAPDRRHVVPVHRVLPEAGQARARPDRARSHAHRPALPGRSRPGGRQPRARSQALLPLLRPQEDRGFLESAQERHGRMAEAHGRARDPRRTSR